MSDKTLVYEELYSDRYNDWKNWNRDNFGQSSRFDRRYFVAELRRAGRHFDRGARVLEIGFGNGAFLSFARDSGWDICGTEVNDDLIDIATDHEFPVFKDDELGIFDENSFDLVVAFDVLEHIEPDRILGVFRNIRRVLKENGVFLARFPNGDSPFGMIYQNGDLTHRQSIGSEKAKYLANASGMETIFVGGSAYPVRGVNAKHLFHSMIVKSIKGAINYFISKIFYQRADVAFCSSNLTLVCKAGK